MREFLPYVVIGLTTGSLYAIAAMGLVVTYTTSGVFNFAQGAVGMIATFVFYSLRVDAGLPTPVAAAVAVLVVGPALGLVIDRVLFRRLHGASPGAYVVVSLGLLVALQGFAVAVYGPVTRQVKPFFPTSSFELADVRVGIDQLLIVAIAAAAAVLLVGLLKRTRLGVYTRAVVEDPGLTQLKGVDSRRITAFSWMLGSAFAALSGVLLAPVLGLDALILTLLVLQAFGAAAVGRLVSVPGAYFGALALGVAASVSTKYVAQHPSVAGIPSSLPFILLFAVLVGSRQGRFAELVRKETAMRPRRAGRPVRTRLSLPVLLSAIVLALVVPSRLNGSTLLTATSLVIFVLIFSSLGLLVGLARQVSLAHAVFVVLGATTTSHLQAAGVPYLLALLLSGLVLVPVGAVVAIPAIRLSGLFLALATFGFGILAQNLLFTTSFAFGQTGIVRISRPELFGVSLGSDRAFYFFAVGMVIIGVLAVELVRMTRLGRLLRALADSPTAVESLGVNPVASRVLVFCLAAFLAAVAGGLQGTLIGAVNSSSFGFLQSLLWVTVLVSAGAASLGGAILAAFLLVGVPALVTSATVLDWQPVAFGIAAMIFAQAPNGLVGMLGGLDFTRFADASAWRVDQHRRRLERLTQGAG